MGLAEQVPDNETISIDATYLKAHRTASSLRLKKGAWTPDWADQRRHEHQAACSNGHQRSPNPFLYHGRAPSRTCTHVLSGSEAAITPERQL